VIIQVARRFYAIMRSYVIYSIGEFSDEMMHHVREYRPKP